MNGSLLVKWSKTALHFSIIVLIKELTVELIVDQVVSYTKIKQL